MAAAVVVGFAIYITNVEGAVRVSALSQVVWYSLASGGALWPCIAG
jgi:hypothetical protein